MTDAIERKSDKNGAIGDRIEETREERSTAKNRKGRSKKYGGDNSAEVTAMRNHLSKRNKAGFELKFGRYGKVEHSPVKTRAQAVGNRGIALDDGELREEAGKEAKETENESEGVNDVVEPSNIGKHASLRKIIEVEHWISVDGINWKQKVERESIKQLQETRDKSSTRTWVGERAGEVATTKQQESGSVSGGQEQKNNVLVEYVEFKEWMDGRMSELECKLDRVRAENIALREEIKMLNEQHARESQLVGSLQRELVEFRKLAESKGSKIEVIGGKIEEKEKER